MSNEQQDQKRGKHDRKTDDKNEELNEGLEESFPASDPVSVSQPTRTGAPGEFKKKKPDDKK